MTIQPCSSCGGEWTAGVGRVHKPGCEVFPTPGPDLQPGIAITIAVDVILPYRGRVLFRIALVLCSLAAWFANRATRTVRVDPGTGRRLSARDQMARERRHGDVATAVATRSGASDPVADSA